MRIHKDWNNWDDEKRQKYVNNLKRVYPDGHPYSVYQNKSASSKDSGASAGTTLAPQKKLNIGALFDNIPPVNNTPPRPIWERPLNEDEVNEFKKEFSDFLSENSGYLLRFAQHYNPDITKEKWLKDTTEENAKPLAEGRSLGFFATEEGNWQSERAKIARKMLYSKYASEIKNEKLQEDVKKTSEWLFKYENSYTGASFMSKLVKYSVSRENVGVFQRRNRGETPSGIKTFPWRLF